MYKWKLEVFTCGPVAPVAPVAPGAPVMGLGVVVLGVGMRRSVGQFTTVSLPG